MGAGSLINLHTHTTFSDGSYRPEVIVKRAIDEGLTHIAITDHIETAKVPSLPLVRLDDYIGHIRALGRKYEGVIEVLAGVEIDTDPSRSDLFSFPVEELNRLDLVLFEYVEDDVFGGVGFDDLDLLLEGITIPKGLAHVDVERVFGHLRPEELADMLESRGLFMEVNTAGPYRREGEYFFERAQDHYRAFRGRVGVSLGTDTHRILPAMSNVRYAQAFVERMGLLNDLIIA